MHNFIRAAYLFPAAIAVLVVTFALVVEMAGAAAPVAAPGTVTGVSAPGTGSTDNRDYRGWQDLRPAVQVDSTVPAAAATAVAGSTGSHDYRGWRDLNSADK